MNPTNPTEKFQTTVMGAVNEAAQNGVHPALIHTILAGCQSDVLAFIKKMSQTMKASPELSPQEQGNEPPASPASPASPPTPPDNVIPLPQADSN